MWVWVFCFVLGHRLTDATVDYNSWVESKKALKLASTLDKDTIIVEGAFPPSNSGFQPY
jgi:hypothetical protein